MTSTTQDTARCGCRRALAVVGLAAIEACTGPSAWDTEEPSTSPESGGDAARLSEHGDPTMAVVTYGGDGDALGSVAGNGAQQASDDLGVEVTCEGEGDATAQTRRIYNAVSQGATAASVEACEALELATDTTMPGTPQAHELVTART